MNLHVKALCRNKIKILTKKLENGNVGNGVQAENHSFCVVSLIVFVP